MPEARIESNRSEKAAGYAELSNPDCIITMFSLALMDVLAKPTSNRCLIYMQHHTSAVGTR